MLITTLARSHKIIIVERLQIEKALQTLALEQSGLIKEETAVKVGQWIGADIRDINFAGAYKIRRFIIDQNYLKEFRDSSRFSSFIYKMWWATSDCGRSVIRWSLWILLLIFFFALIYTYVAIDYGEHQTWFSSIYYSVVTITTLGYGDVLPASFIGQVVAIAEVISGYVMLGGLISIFSNKVARRAE